MKYSGAALLCSVITVTFFKESYQDVTNPSTNSVGTLLELQGDPALYQALCNIAMISDVEGLAPARCFITFPNLRDISKLRVQSGSCVQRGSVHSPVAKILGDHPDGVKHSKLTLVQLKSSTDKLLSAYFRFLPRPEDFSELRTGNSFRVYGYSTEEWKKRLTTMKYTKAVEGGHDHVFENEDKDSDVIWLGAPIYNSNKMLVAICTGLSESGRSAFGTDILDYFRDYLLPKLPTSAPITIFQEWEAEIQRHQSSEEFDAQFYEKNSLTV